MNPEQLRETYEQSLSWRLTRPVRAAGRLVRRTRPAPDPRREITPADEPTIDTLLKEFYGDELARLDQACAGSDGPERYALFRHLDDDLWALLLTQRYELYPHIRALLPDVPDPALQEMWNGRSGVALAPQTKAFYVKLRERFARYGRQGLATATVLDFGCGWGRISRYLARDVAPGHLCGCDPVQDVLDVCHRTGVPIELARSEFLPEAIPFDRRFDLAYAFSVFTHLSESAHERCLEALHGCLATGGVLVVTVRPPGFIESWTPILQLLEAMGSDTETALTGPRFIFLPHLAVPEHPQYGGEEMHYGDAIITMDYIREHWSSRFELLDVTIALEDPQQVVLTLRKR